MQITLTGADIALSLAVGIIGSLVAAYLFRNVPRWFERAVTLWAERSRKTALARVERLRSDLAHIEALKADARRHTGWMFKELVSMLLYLGVALMLQIYFVTSIMLRGPLFVTVLVFTLFIMGLVLFIRKSIRVEDFTDLEKRRNRIDEQIMRLHNRWGV